jgi:hypothetical protein
MQFYRGFYPKFQDMFLQMRAVVKGDVEVTKDFCEVWHSEMLKMDKLLRDRLFILTIAAEGGWKMASEVAFRKKVPLQNHDCVNIPLILFL